MSIFRMAERLSGRGSDSQGFCGVRDFDEPHPNGINVELGFFPHRDEMFRESMAEYQAAAREGDKKLKAKARGKKKPARDKIPA